MPTSKRTNKRKQKALKYGAKDAVYQQRLADFKESKRLGYEYPKYPPRRNMSALAYAFY